MPSKNTARSLIAGLLLMLATGAQATMVSYVLDRSDVFEDGFDYLSVTVVDEAEEGLLSITVNMLDALTSMGGDGAGIQALSFNFADSVLEAQGFELPDGWSASYGHDSDVPSMYDVTVFGGEPMTPLKIYVGGLSVDELLNEFAVLVTGLPADGEGCSVEIFEDDCSDEGARAYFYGARLVDDPAQVVPVPASLWLLGSGLLGLVSVARRRVS